MPRRNPIEVQISAKCTRPHCVTITGEMLRAAVQYRLDRGEDPPGIELKITGWIRGHRSGAYGPERSQEKLWEDFQGPLRARLWTLGRWGLVNTTASDRLLMLDYDFRRIPKMRPLYVILRIVGLTMLGARTDRTRRGWHVLIWLKDPLPPTAIVALQAIMGSDRRRETLNVMRALSVERHDPGPYWRQRWNLLFERKIP